MFDTYISVENVTGSGFGHTLVGIAGFANTLDGGGGDDFLYGEGIDTFIGGAGNDVLFGGQGSTWGSTAGDTITAAARRR